MALGLKSLLFNAQLLFEELAVGSFAAQLGIDRKVELPLIGQLLLYDPMAVLENVGTIACPTHFRLQLLKISLGGLSPVKEILEKITVALAEHPPLVPPTKRTPTADKP